MQIQLRFFARVREALNTSYESVVLPDGVVTIEDVRLHLCRRGGVWAEVLNEWRGLRVAYNQQMVEPDTTISEGGEIAFFPPVTGG